MDNKAKLISIIFAGLAIVCAAIAYLSFSAKQTLQSRYEKQIKEISDSNNKLEKQLAKSEDERRRIQQAMNIAESSVNKITAERDELQKNYESALKEKERLSAELAKRSGVMPVMASIPEAQPSKGVSPQIEKGYWANIIKEKSALELKLKTLTEELIKIKLQVEDASGAKKNLELALSELTQMKDDLTRKLAYNEQLADNLSNELTREVNDKQYLFDQYNHIKQENMALKSQIKDLSTAKVALEKNLVRQQEEVSDLDKRLSETEQIVQYRISDIEQLKRDIEQNIETGSSINFEASQQEARPVQLPPIVVYAQGQGSKGVISSQQKSGRVISIDEMNDFIIIDLGENDGVSINDKFAVYHGSKQIATIQIIQLRKDISAADIIDSSDKIRPDDTVKSL